MEKRTLNLQRDTFNYYFTNTAQSATISVGTMDGSYSTANNGDPVRFTETQPKEGILKGYSEVIVTETVEVQVAGETVELAAWSTYQVVEHDDLTVELDLIEVRVDGERKEVAS
jgi:hypothetical protein